MPFTDPDTVEHPTEPLIWDSPRQLRARRAELASRVAEDQADDRQQPEQQGDPANPFIAVEPQAIARIEARLKELHAR
jgi:hypothetical protein